VRARRPHRALPRHHRDDIRPAKYGREFDFSVGRSFGERYALLLKSAFFDARDAAFADTRKYWLMFTADY
jgi:hypothetical protein